MSKTNLTTAPSFIFYQGELLSDSDAEFPLEVTYWNEGDIVGIKLLDNSKSNIIIRTKDLKKLVKEIERHLPEAVKKLKTK